MSLESTIGFTITDDAFSKFQKLLYKESGIKLGDQKKTMMVSRLSKRLRALEMTSFKDYYNYILEEGTEGEEFIQMLDLLSTNKTDFFREPIHFDFMTTQIIPELKYLKKIRIWSSACSSGEEPYSIAITLAEAFGTERWNAKVLASDLSTRVLAKARNGVYEKESVKDLNTIRLHKYFLKGKGEEGLGKVKIKKHLSEMVSFRRINLMGQTYPIKSPLDIIFCRNVMIYFDRPTQERLINNFYSYLKPNGYLFIGHSESLQWLDSPFTLIKPTIYQKKEMDVLT